ncbi:MAG TPA: hypothetical protein PKE21_16900, partial [Flavobacteriales bacterium]|nr:hypothetical protein [Flavobacteriales bacterium]HMR29158.1 hypothetical protein [Flavobacteriales bacterium]
MPYTATGTFNGPNTFTAQLSDASGSFASPVDIGSVSSTTSGSISCTIPTNTIGGNGYRIRVVSSDPVVTGTDNGSDITIDQPTTWYADTDNDGFGELAVDSIACTQPVGYVADNSDNCPALPGQIGDPCDDGLANTSNDVITASCTCAGTFTPPGGYPTPPGSGIALDFDGVNDKVVVPDAPTLDGATAFSLETWVLFHALSPSGTAQDQQPIISKWFSSGVPAENSYLLTETNGNLNFSVSSGTAGSGISYTGHGFSTGTWYHVAGTFDAGTMKLYVNGIEVASGTLPVTSLGNGTQDLKLGDWYHDNNTSYSTLHGRLDETRIWIGAALTEAEIRDHLCKKDLSAHPQLASLAAYFRYDDGTGTQLLDISGQGNHGTLTNMDPGTDWVLSGAPIGDLSAHTYGGSTITLTDGTSFTADNYTGSPVAVHVYKVNEAPNNVTVPSGFTALETSEYYGVHVIGGTNPQYSATWNYSGNVNVDGASGEADARLAKRNDNADATWAIASAASATNTGANTIVAANQNGTEFSIGFMGPVPPCADGTYDLTFTPGSGAEGTQNTVASLSSYPLPDGRAIVAGYFTSYDGAARNRIVRINADGTVDPTFNPGSGANSWIGTTAIQPDGKILIGGDFTTYDGVARNRIARLNADGTLDAGFNPGSGLNNRCYALALQPDGKVVVVGNFTSVNGTARNRVARLNADGSLDAGFNPGTASNNTMLCVAMQADGKVLIGGDMTSFNGTARNYVARLNTDGSLDASFNAGAGPNGQVSALAVQADGNVLLGGTFTTVNGTGRNRVARVTSTGALDASFDPGTGADNKVRGFAVLSDSRIFMVGDFTTYNGVATASRFVRLLGTGGLDPAFDDGNGGNGDLYCLNVLSDGRVLIGGSLTTYDGIASSGIARVGQGVDTDGDTTADCADGCPLDPLKTDPGTCGCGVADTDTDGDLTADCEDDCPTDPLKTTPGICGCGTPETGDTDGDGLADCVDNCPALFGQIGDPCDDGIASTSGDVITASCSCTGTFTVPGGYPTPPGSGVALDFDGVNDRVTLPLNMINTPGSGAITIEYWLRSTVTTSQPMTYSIEGMYISRVYPDGSITVTYDGTTVGSQQILAGLNDGKWHHVAGVHSGGNTSVYVDGSLVGGQAEVLADIDGLNRSSAIGSQYDGIDSPFAGRIDEFRIWNGVALTQAEIRDHLCKKDLNAHPQLAGLEAYYRFDDGSGTVLQDISGHGHHGTLTNMDAATDWVTSGAPLGDLSAHTYGGSTVTLTDGTSFTADTYTGSPAAVHVYKVNEAPNNTAPPTGLTSLETSEYFGVHVIGGTNPQYSATWDYSGNGAVDGQANEGDARLAKRDDNADATWALGTTPAGTNTTANTITATAQSGTEYIIGFTPSGAGCDPASYDFSYLIGNGANAAVRAIAVQPDGKAVVAGDFTSFDGTAINRMVRLTPDGIVDGSFNAGLGPNVGPSAVAVQPDGKIIIGGAFTSVNGTTRNRIARLNADGTLDATFNPGSGANDFILAVVLQPDGKVLVGGNFTTMNGSTRNRIARLNADGSLDGTFNPGTGPNDRIERMVLQPNGAVLVSGQFTSISGTGRSRVARLTATGGLDATFNPGTGANSTVSALALQPDGKVLIGGSFTTFNGTGRNRIARLNANGSLDTGFNPGTGVDAVVRWITVQVDGRALIGGDFTTYNGTARGRYARVLTTGGLDTSYDPGAGASSSLLAIALQDDGRALIGGSLTSYNGVSTGYLARVNGDPLSLTAVSSTGPFAPPSALTVDYAIGGCGYGAGNTFSVELSDASGSFASPTVIGTVNSTASGSIACSIPFGTPAGTGYRVRVSSSSPAQLSADNGVDLVILQPYPEPPGSGVALDFDGTNDYVRFTTPGAFDPGTGSFTTEAWIRFNVSSIAGNVYPWQKNGGGGVAGGAGGAESDFYSLYFTASGYPRWYLRDAAGTQQFFTYTQNMLDQQWHHYACVRDVANARMQLYIDGFPVIDEPLTVLGDIAPANDLFLCAYEVDGATTFTGFFPGRMDEFRYWSAALTEAEIRDHLCKKDLSAHPQLA